MRTLEGQTALISGGGRPLGRAIALALAARGVRIVVTGIEEKALGETVGEIVHAGGKARHLAGATGDVKVMAAAVERAFEVFGRLDIAIATDPMSVDYMFSAVARRMPGPGRLFLAGAAAGGDAGDGVPGDRVRTASREVAAKSMTCNAIVAVDPTAAASDDASDQVAAAAAALVVFLCSRAGGAITGQAIAVRSRLPS